MPVPIPAPVTQVKGQDVRLPSSSEGSLDKENSVPGSQWSIVTELVAIVEEEHLDIGGESGHMLAHQVQDKWFVQSLVRNVDQRLIRCAVIVTFILSLDWEMEEMVSRLVAKDEGNRTSEEEIVSGSEGPNISKRVEMAMQISRPDTAQMVLRSRKTLFLPENHPLLSLMDQSFATFGVQGTVSASSSGPSLYHLEL